MVQATNNSRYGAVKMAETQKTDNKKTTINESQKKTDSTIKKGLQKVGAFFELLGKGGFTLAFTALVMTAGVMLLATPLAPLGLAAIIFASTVLLPTSYVVGRNELSFYNSKIEDINNN